ncbi:hypothetical protein JD844_003907 [Phrynosoma platyrhinos]|uniref:PIH1D1/2/3 CS-like domain-containing protein n=1 Tax=Phrynosoma platyrhinos TaxID=52577 RepID=A0ABQ7TMJ1_PHRPL|nr:hypothetical protein JD844_003907 [Phrynosoma platyrhinos]
MEAAAAAASVEPWGLGDAGAASVRALAQLLLSADRDQDEGEAGGPRVSSQQGLLAPGQPSRVASAPPPSSSPMEVLPAGRPWTQRAGIPVSGPPLTEWASFSLQVSSWVRSAGPGDIGPPKEPSGPSATAEAEAKPGHNKEIWSTDEVPEGSDYDDAWDPREQPEFPGERQLIRGRIRNCWLSAGFPNSLLGTYGLRSHSAAAEIKIKLPGMKASDITLDIREKFLDLRSPQKKLLLHLPHPVDAKNGRACFLQEKGILEVTLRMKREFDFINFA